VVEISIIVPVFNEADNILPMAREVAAAMQTVARPYELVFVDDASRDATWEKIQEARRADARVRGMRLSRNSGQSAALWTGIQATTSPILATLDGDLQNDPADLPRLLAELVNYDFICGARQKRQDNFLRRASTKVARWARKTMLKVDFADTGCAARAFKRTALHGLFGFNGLHRFLPVLVHGGGAKTLEIPVHHRPRVAGVSKYGMWNRLGRGIYDLFAVAWFQKRRTPVIPFTELADEPVRESAGSRR
jgi:dolichol-phosphate mannosyltransferase